MLRAKADGKYFKWLKEKKMKDESKTFSIRIKQSLLDWFKEQSEKERRSLNNYLEGVLLDHKKRAEKK